jgi:multidrug resistance efflux pump
MATPFSRSLRSLSKERSLLTALFLVVLTLLLAAWLAWFLRARLPLYVVSETARLEAERAVYPISAQVSGRLRRVAVAMGQEVAAGDVLFELESEVEERRIEEEQARAAALVRQLDSLRAEKVSRAEGMAAALRGADMALREAEERLRAAEAGAALAAEEVERQARLHAQGLLPDLDLSRLRAEAERSRNEVAELRIACGRLREERSRDESDRRNDLREIERDFAAAEGDLAARQATIRRLRTESGWRLVRAPVAGRIGELARLDGGAVIAAGERLGTVIPGERLKVLAGFPPAQALGRVRPGQTAELRLDAFPWTEYGGARVRVARVGGELRDGRVWVELTLEPGGSGRIPLQHGLPGTVVVETERLSPAGLLLRVIGAEAARRTGAPAR